MKRMARESPADALALGASALTAGPALAPDVEAGIHCAQATALFHLQNLQQSRDEAAEGIRIVREVSGSSEVLARCLGTLGNAEQTLGNHSAAIAAYAEGREVAQSTGDSALYSALSNNLGFLLQKMGELEAAAEAYVSALADIDAIEPLRLARRLNNIGTLYNDLGRHRLALDYLERSRDAFESSGGGPRRYKILVNESIAWRGLGEPERALELLHEALPLQRKIGDARGAAVSLANTGGALGDLQRFGEALYSLDEALEVQRGLGLKGDVASTLADKARILASSGDFVQAVAVAEESLQQARALEMPLVAKAAMEVLADGYEALDFPAEALASLREATGLDDRLKEEALAEELVALERAGARISIHPEMGRWWGLALGAVLIAVLLSMAQVLRTVPQFAGAPGDLVDLEPEDEDQMWSVCSYCKNVQDQRGGWVSFEAELRTRRGIQTSHGICPACLAEIRSEFIGQTKPKP